MKNQKCNKELCLLVTDIQYEQNNISLKLSPPIIVIYGNLLTNQPIKVLIKDYIPYFYIEASHEINPNILNDAIKKNFKKAKCMGVQKVMKKSIYGYCEKEKPFYQVYFNDPVKMKNLVEVINNMDLKVKIKTVKKKYLNKTNPDIESKEESDSTEINITFNMYESTYSHVLRFMCDQRITGMSYLRVLNYTTIESTSILTVESECNLLKPIPLEGEFMKLVSLKILSFDIECCNNNNEFPKSDRDPVIQIGNTVQRFGVESVVKRDIFCLEETAEIMGATVHSFSREDMLLQAWKRYILKEDPDIIIGYNITGFDFPYLFGRAKALGLTKFGCLGRSDRLYHMVNKQQSSSSFGAFDAYDIKIDGRIIFDLYHVVRRNYKLRSYSLNSVSYHFLGEQKEDVSYKSMSELQRGGPETRQRIASYCLKDTYLPMQLFERLNVLINNSELARVTHVPIEYFSSRGAAIKVLAQIHWEASIYGYVIPDMFIKGGETQTYEGAFVMNPLRGFYSEPVAVLDFSSLYPSIIISKNMCYTTLLNKEQFKHMGGFCTPTNDYFCFTDEQEGLLPRILKDLLTARKEAKRQLAATEDVLLRKSLEGRQLALKICANSIYGFTGSPTGQLPCIEISRSTTAFGRDMIAKTKEMIEINYCKAMGYDFNAQVIYGDTDSVMINFLTEKEQSKICNDKNISKFNNNDANISNNSMNINNNSDNSHDIGFSIAKTFEEKLEYVRKISKNIVNEVTKTFDRPISLEFEKIYCPYLLINKKRYAGLIYTVKNTPDKIDMKGIETVRRDNCELVKDVIQICLDKILYNKDILGAMNHVKQVVQDLYLGNIDISKLVITKTYTKSNYTNKQAHTELIEKLRNRGFIIGIGERIPYIIVKGDNKMITYERSEDPVYVLEHSLPIDNNYYIEQQLTKPIERLFEPLMDNVSSLFQGEHTKVINNNADPIGPLNKFITKIEKCIGCGSRGIILCKFCKNEFPQHFKKTINLYNQKTTQFNECWVECQRCQGSLFNDVICVNVICPIWYKRTKIKKELIIIQENLEKLYKISW